MSHVVGAESVARGESSPAVDVHVVDGGCGFSNISWVFVNGWFMMVSFLSWCNFFGGRSSSVPEPGLNTMFRGGAGGSAATKRKRQARAAQFEVMNRLCNLLGPLLGTESNDGKTKQTKNKKKKKTKLVNQEPGKQNSLVDELVKVVEKIKTNPGLLILELEGFLKKAKLGNNGHEAGLSGAGMQSAAKQTSKKVSENFCLAKHCWSLGEIRDFGELIQGLQSGVAPTGGVSLAPSLSKAFEARDLVHVHKLQDRLKFACVVPGVDQENLPEGVLSLTLPVTKGTGFAGPGIRSTRFEKFACVFLGTEKPRLPSLVKEISSVPEKVDLITVRFHVPKVFSAVEHWKEWSRDPAAVLLQWLGDTTLIHSSYGWAVTAQTNRNGNKEEFMVGYAKVQKTHLSKVLDKSGQNGAFCDRLAKERSNETWVLWQDLQNDDYFTYLATALSAAMAKSQETHSSVPLVWRASGGNCVGLKLKERPAPNVVTWRAKSVPFSWTETELLSVLDDAGWKDVAIIAYPTRTVRPWLLRAKCPADVDRVAGICHSSSGVMIMIIMERAGPMGPASRNHKRVAVAPRVARHANVLALNPVVDVPDDVDDDVNEVGEAAKAADAEMVAPTVLESQDSTMDTQAAEGGVKRLAASPNTPPKTKKEKKAVEPKQLTFPGFSVVDCGADGSCAYNVIAVGSALMRGGQLSDLLPKQATMGATLRVQVATHVAKPENAR